MSSNDGRVDGTCPWLKGPCFLHADAFLLRASYCLTTGGRRIVCYLSERFCGGFLLHGRRQKQA